jgi:hypothetical protein
MQELIGKTVTNILIEKTGESIIFKTDSGDVKYSAEGDCCAYCWIDSLIDVSNLINAGQITKIEDGYLDNSHERYEDEVEDNECHDIYTDKGVCKLIYKVSHNGYYGGWLSHRDKFWQEEKIVFEEVTEDWVCNND